MKDKAAQILTLLKQDKSYLPYLILLISFLFTSYLLYPHNSQKTEVAGIAISKATPKVSPTATPAHAVLSYKKSQSSTKNVPTITASSQTNSAETIASTANNASSTDKTPSNSSSAPASSSSNNSDTQNSPTPTTVQTPTDTPDNNNNVTITTPTVTPVDNGNIVQVTIAPVPQSDNGGTIIANIGTQ